MTLDPQGPSHGINDCTLSERCSHMGAFLLPQRKGKQRTACRWGPAGRIRARKQENGHVQRKSAACRVESSPVSPTLTVALTLSLYCHLMETVLAAAKNRIYVLGFRWPVDSSCFKADSYCPAQSPFRRLFGAHNDCYRLGGIHRTRTKTVRVKTAVLTFEAQRSIRLKTFHAQFSFTNGDDLSSRTVVILSEQVKKLAQTIGFSSAAYEILTRR